MLFFRNISYEYILVHALKDISDFSTVRLNVVVVVFNVVVVVYHVVLENGEHGLKNNVKEI